MALPQKVADRLQWETPKTPGWAGHLLMFTGFIFFITIAVYVGLLFGYKPYLQSQINKEDNRIRDLKNEISPVDEARVAAFYSQLTNLKMILRNHVVATPLFEWLEKNTGANTYYNKFSLDVSTRKLTIGGFARTAEDALLLLRNFENQPEVQQAHMASLAITPTASAWQFFMTVTFSPEFFTAPR